MLTEKMIEAAFRVFSDRMLMREEDKEFIGRVLEAALSTDAEPVEPFGWTSKHINDSEQHRLWGRKRENVSSRKGDVVQALYVARQLPAPSVAEWIDRSKLRPIFDDAEGRN